MEEAPRRPRVEIRYCNQCRWLLRSAWMAQELLTTFADQLGEVALSLGHSGVFQIRVDEQLTWCRERDGGFPDIKQLKQLVRDRVAPEMELGHSERKSKASGDEPGAAAGP